MTPRIYAPLGSALVPWHPAGDQPAIRIGIVTDDQGLDSEHDALVRHAPDYLQPREYRLSASGLCSDHRLGLHQLQVLLRDHNVDAIHLASPRLAGLWTRWLSVRLGLPLISTYHGAPGDNAVDRWPSVRGIARRHYESWLYGRCARVAISSERGRQHLLREGWPSERLVMATAGVDPDTFSPAKRSTSLRDAWRVSTAGLPFCALVTGQRQTYPSWPESGRSSTTTEDLTGS